MLGRGADAAFATNKPCEHGTVLADLCGLCRKKGQSVTDTVRYSGEIETLAGERFYVYTSTRNGRDYTVSVDGRDDLPEGVQIV